MDDRCYCYVDLNARPIVRCANRVRWLTWPERWHVCDAHRPLFMDALPVIEADGAEAKKRMKARR